MADTTYTVRTPNAGFSGTRHGVLIHEGTGTTDDADQALRCHEMGYTVTPDPTREADPTGLDDIDGIGPATLQKLSSEDVTSIQGLAALTDDAIDAIAEATGLSVEQLSEWRGRASAHVSYESTD